MQREAVVDVSLYAMAALDTAREGTLEAWFISERGDTTSAGRLTSDAAVIRSSTAPAQLLITVEPPGDADPRPSSHHLLIGRIAGGRAELTLRGAVTASTLPLREDPGQFTMFTPSDNATHPFPSNETSGVWLFNAEPRVTRQNDMWVRLAQLRSGWLYEGWVVRDFGAPNAIWLSYGKFNPDQAGVVNRRDATGWGIFSGVPDYRTAGAEDFPGDDWVGNPLGFPFPSSLTLPLDLTERTTAGQPRWSHVITIEPSFDQDEALTMERPFPLFIYRDEIRTTRPGESQSITLRADAVPRGDAVVKQ